MEITKYFDKHNKEIKEGMSIRHDDGDIDLVYMDTDGDLGLNASNENHASFCEHSRELYPLHQFDMREWEIVE